MAAGIVTDTDAAGVELTASPCTKRGMGMTLSPGEEYENHQKVLATMMEDDNVSERGDRDRRYEPRDDTISRQKSPRQTENKGEARHEQVPKSGSGLTKPNGFSQRRLAHYQTEPVDRGKEGVQQPLKASMINPLGRFRLVWDISSISFICYNAIVLPFQASFDVEAKDNPFEALVDVFFLVDMILTFNTAIEKDGSMCYNRRIVAEKYFETWFIVDLIAALPYGYVFTEDGNYSATLRKSLKLLRLVRLLRLLRISRILRRIQNTIFIRSTFSSLIKYCFMVVFLNHWFSCIFHAIASSDMEHSWVKAQRLNEPLANKWDRYVAALYVAVQTLSTIGFGDVSAQSANERLFCVFAMIVGGGFFAYGITNIVELVSSLTIQETVFRQKLDEVNEYMKARELPVKLRMEIREFYHNTRQSRESKLNSEQQILNDLSSKLRSKIALSINDQFLRKFPFFTGSEPNFLMELALNMRVIHFAPLENAVIEGELGHEMFFIVRGAVEVVKNDVRIGILGENQYFGEMAILSPDNHRTATVRTLCFCELRMLSRARFLEALALFPDMQSKIAQVAQLRAAFNLKHDLVSEKPKQKASQSSARNRIAAAALSLTKSENRAYTLKKPRIGNTDDDAPMTEPAPLSSSQSSVARLPVDLRPSHLRAPSSVRTTMNVRHNSGSAGSLDVSPDMTRMITEVASLLQEATRRQDMLVNKVLQLKKELDRMRRPDTDTRDVNGIE